jgi:hypothetical protein
MNKYKEQPNMMQIAEIGGLPELTNEQKEGIAIAAWICRSYGAGDIWAEVIECHGEQQRARYWMKISERTT